MPTDRLEIRDPRVELVYDTDCPHADTARGMIRHALSGLGSASQWIEWNRDDPNTPAALRRYGSPTVLVNGRDVASEENEDTGSEGNSCRVYTDESGRYAGAPSAELIARALKEARDA
jgi:mercuric ion transport protein